MFSAAGTACSPRKVGVHNRRVIRSGCRFVTVDLGREKGIALSAVALNWERHSFEILFPRWAEYPFLSYFIESFRRIQNPELRMKRVPETARCMSTSAERQCFLHIYHGHVGTPEWHTAPKKCGQRACWPC